MDNIIPDDMTVSHRSQAAPGRVSVTLQTLLGGGKVDVLVVLPQPEGVSRATAVHDFVRRHFPDIQRRHPNLVVLPNGSTVRVHANPQMIDLVGFHLDAALIIGPVSTDVLREVRYRLVARRGKFAEVSDAR